MEGHKTEQCPVCVRERDFVHRVSVTSSHAHLVGVAVMYEVNQTGHNTVMKVKSTYELCVSVSLSTFGSTTRKKKKEEVCLFLAEVTKPKTHYKF